MINEKWNEETGGSYATEWTVRDEYTARIVANFAIWRSGGESMRHVDRIVDELMAARPKSVLEDSGGV